MQNNRHNKPAHPTAISRPVEFGLPARRRMALTLGRRNMMRIAILSGSILVLAFYLAAHQNAPYPTKVFYSTYLLLAFTVPLLMVCRTSRCRIAVAIALSWATTFAWGLNTEIIARKMEIPITVLAIVASIESATIVAFTTLLKRIIKEK